MPVEEVEVTISPDGEVSIEVRGMKGMDCRTATAALETALGGEVIERRMTAEAYESVEVDQANQQSTGGEW